MLHVSDIHCGPPFLNHVAEALVRLSASLEPDVLVLSGDFTQRAKPHQFQQARALIGMLPQVPRVVVPGNHDVPLYRIWERLTDPYRAYREHLGAEREAVLQLPGLLVVALDSTSPRRTITRGRITRRQVEWAVAQLERAGPEDARIVVAHHHFVEAPDALSDRTMLGGDMALRAFVQARVDLVLGGHLHRAFIGDSLDFFFEGPRDRGAIVVQAGTATSRRGRGRERERNSFNLIRIRGTWIGITHYLYFEDENEFSPISHHIFPRAGHRLGRKSGDVLAALGEHVAGVIGTRPDPDAD
ncbi:MAG: 3',5'-cyclic-nucleotide phosphodiesterase [Acidobacteria bacterium]|nr:MAG: 3',5'-cyclic-nucleotide phosphodiesterase [Acidobacteriota bacterium]REK09189.1 MAG: 3',5'-cyclic-nucleotide phosphodiesterase [Acidobacteriota bacterium]